MLCLRQCPPASLQFLDGQGSGIDGLPPGSCKSTVRLICLRKYVGIMLLSSSQACRRDDFIADTRTAMGALKRRTPAGLMGRALTFLFVLNDQTGGVIFMLLGIMWLCRPQNWWDKPRNDGARR